MSKVLLIDDSDPWCATVSCELGKAGHTVVRARDQEEAIAAATDQRPSLVLVDLLLAAKAGAGFVRKLRSLPAMRNIPMLLTTAGTNRQMAQHAVGQAADQIITKDRGSLDAIAQRLAKLPMAG
jgi:CheY-like chemotaxis protein